MQRDRHQLRVDAELDEDRRAHITDSTFPMPMTPDHSSNSGATRGNRLRGEKEKRQAKESTLPG
jgi:hypothetical protein